MKTLPTVRGRSSAAFRAFYGSFVVSLLGDAFRLLAVNVWIFEATRGSATQRLVLVLLGNLPGLLLGGVSGVLADRWDAYRVLVASDLLRLGVGLGLAACAATSRPEVALALVAVGNGLGVFFTTSAFTVLPRLVDAEQLPRANGLFETSQWVVQVVGASLAALTLATAGAATAFVLDAGSFLASALLLVRLRTLLTGAPTAGTDGDSVGGGWRSFGAGVRLVVRSPQIRVLLLASYGVTFLAACTNFTLIFLVSESLGQGAATLGLLYSVNGAVAVAAAAATTAWLRPALLGRAMALAMT